MTNKEQYEESLRQIEQTIGYDVRQAHGNGEGAVTPKQLLDERMRTGGGINAAEYIAAIKGIGKSMGYRGLLTNTGTDDDPSWAPTRRLLEDPSPCPAR